ncbi:uncharacterized protein LOC108622288 [Ceratina calcarata]|uniref:Uncharacterized protein LOC108622288 n=1 Tax=Ceratina calcarata TaxID=156304 RepID=A0AAJ7ISM5_9HYME|nr:uncharacterized protein LOC108622288 [Ceratina calcarata]
MNAILYTFLQLNILHSCFPVGRIAVAITTLATETTTVVVERETERDEEQEEEQQEIENVPMTEQVMDPDIKITDVPDVEETIEEDREATWDKNKVIRDVAYYIRAHKFRDYDRRYHKQLEDSPYRLYEQFPKPPLRSLHWEVRRHCDASFVECLKYLERVIERTALKREDDTVTVMKKQKWNPAEHEKEILAAQKDCQTALKRDDLTVIPFQGPIERFQWRTTVSYYMCWYTMLEVPELSIFGESCDNHADCQFPSEGDPRADDAQPYACALYSFCPDHCCPIKRVRDMTDCYQSTLNPCYAGNPPAERECTLNRQENQDLLSLVANRINISCECRDAGYEWSSRFGICVDVNECIRGGHDCSKEDGEICMNLPGNFECVCKFGYVYDLGRKDCVFSSEIEDVLAGEKDETNVTKTKSIIDQIVKAIARSHSDRVAIHRVLLLAATVSTFSLLLNEME